MSERRDIAYAERVRERIMQAQIGRREAVFRAFSIRSSEPGERMYSADDLEEITKQTARALTEATSEAAARTAVAVMRQSQPDFERAPEAHSVPPVAKRWHKRAAFAGGALGAIVLLAKGVLALIELIH